MTQQTVLLPVSAYIEAASLSRKFNVFATKDEAAGAKPDASKVDDQRVAIAVLEKATDMLREVSDQIACGAKLNHGSGWHGPDLFLNKKIVSVIAESVRPGDGLGAATLDIKDDTSRKLQEIAAAFNISSSQAAKVAIETYAFVQDGLWRGNGFSIEKGKQHDPLDFEKFRLPAYKR